MSRKMAMVHEARGNWGRIKAIVERTWDVLDVHISNFSSYCNLHSWVFRTLRAASVVVKLQEMHHEYLQIPYVIQVPKVEWGGPYGRQSPYDMSVRPPRV